jgi:transposase
MQTFVTPEQRLAAKRELVRQVEQGTPVSDARRRCPLAIHRTTVYRLLKRTQREGEQAFIDRRHGHPIKLRGEVLLWVQDYCQSHPAAPSTAVQPLLAERFGLLVSVSQLNRVRAAHGWSRQLTPREKKAENRHGDRARRS